MKSLQIIFCLILIVSLGLTGCQGFHTDDFLITQPSTQWGPCSDGRIYVEGNDIPEILVTDAQSLLEQNTKAFCNSTEKGGVLAVRYSQRVREFNRGWFFPYFLTAGIWGLLGGPVMSQSAWIELEGSLFDSKGKLIKTESVTAEDTTYCALYWGYNCLPLHGDLLKGPVLEYPTSHTRATHANALERGMKKLIEKFNSTSS